MSQNNTSYFRNGMFLKTSSINNHNNDILKSGIIKSYTKKKSMLHAPKQGALKIRYPAIFS